MEEINKFMEKWTTDPINGKEIFGNFYKQVAAKKNVKLDFHARPGVSYSLRAANAEQTDRPLFVMVDVIDDDPDDRWLSVCFYGDMITDPDELGDLIPEGLLGSDGYCFDITESDPNLVKYIEKRIEEAYTNAG
ncbi:MAG: hypothetical protein ACQES8_02530 [Thermodesulfobacteriota bacterium]